MSFYSTNVHATCKRQTISSGEALVDTKIKSLTNAMVCSVTIGEFLALSCYEREMKDCLTASPFLISWVLYVIKRQVGWGGLGSVIQNSQICTHRNLVHRPPKHLPFRLQLKIIHLIWALEKTDKMLSKRSSKWVHLGMPETDLFFCHSKSFVIIFFFLFLGFNLIPILFLFHLLG